MSAASAQVPDAVTAETLRPLEPHAGFDAAAGAGPEAFVERLDGAEIEEILAAVRTLGPGAAGDLLALRREDFDWPRLARRLGRIEGELLDGRGVVVLRGLPRADLSNDEMCLAYWGIGLHLGRPWPQNARGHLLGDVVDQGKRPDDPTTRGNEIGGIGLDYHCDGSDLVGLMCLSLGAEGGASAVASSVAIHNHLVETRPDLALELYRPQPFDYRGEEPAGGRGWYAMPVFTRQAGRLFVRLIRPYILASQRHADAPRLTERAREALAAVQDLADQGRWSAFMDFQPGDMQFVNNYHVLHGRRPYRDDRAAGKVRHLKRLWLETRALAARPPWFENRLGSHWSERASVSRLDRSPA